MSDPACCWRLIVSILFCGVHDTSPYVLVCADTDGQSVGTAMWYSVYTVGSRWRCLMAGDCIDGMYPSSVDCYRLLCIDTLVKRVLLLLLGSRPHTSPLMLCCAWHGAVICSWQTIRRDPPPFLLRWQSLAVWHRRRYGNRLSLSPQPSAAPQLPVASCWFSDHANPSVVQLFTVQCHLSCCSYYNNDGRNHYAIMIWRIL